MKFKYQARTKEGELQAGFVEAGDRDAALQVLANHNLFVLSVAATEKKSWYDPLTSFINRVRRRDLVIFARQLATLLEARLPLSNALVTLKGQTTNETLKNALAQISQDINSGLSFSQALEHQGEIFPTYYTAMIRASEVTGNLNEAATFLADYTEREGVLASKAASALIYPGILLGLVSRGRLHPFDIRLSADRADISREQYFHPMVYRDLFGARHVSPEMVASRHHRASFLSASSWLTISGQAREGHFWTKAR